MTPATSSFPFTNHTSGSPDGGFGGERQANAAFNKIIETAPMGLLLSAALGLAIVGVFQYIFYLDVLPPGWQAPLRHTLSAAIAIFFEALGLFFLITTVRDFSARHNREGWIGAVASLLLLIYALYEIRHVASVFDRDTPETYSTIYAILATIIVIVRVVELRIALTITAAIKRGDDRKTILELTGKVAAYESEMKAASDRKNADEQRQRQAEAEEAERRKQEEQADLRKQLAAATRALAAAEKTDIGKIKINTGKVEAAIRDFIRKNPRMKPTREQIASACNATARAIQNHYKNGSLDAVIDSIFREINAPQLEIKEAIPADYN